MTWTPDPARTFVGLCASRSKWPHGEYEFVVPSCALPLRVDHQEDLFASHGQPDASTAGLARLFCEVDQGLVVLAEVGADQLALAWQVSEGRLAGLSVHAALEPRPRGRTLIFLEEISLTRRPADPDARVLSTGRFALADWELITGQPLPLRPAAALALWPGGHEHARL